MEEKIIIMANVMFDNIGGKIKSLAKIICWIGIVASVIGGVILMAMAEDIGIVFIGLLVLVLGSLASWIGSFMTYGFGQLVENSDILVAKNKNNTVKTTNSIETTSDKIDTLNKWKEKGLITEEEYNEKMENLK